MTKKEILQIAAQSLRGTDYVTNTSEPGAMYHLFVASLAKAIDAKRVVELGTYIAETSKSVAAAVPSASVITVDVNPDAKRQVEQVEPFFTNLQAYTDDAIAFANKYDGKPIDLLFIDINHDFSSTHSAYEAWKGFVRPGGLIVVDDIHLDHETDRFNAYLEENDIAMIDIPEVHATGFGVIIK